MENKFAILCMPDDFYLGDALCRELEKNGRKCLFNLRDAVNPLAPNFRDFTNVDILIAIVCKEFVSNKSLVKIVESHTNIPLDSDKMYLLTSDDIEIFPKQWEDCYLLDARKGLDLSLVEKVIDFKNCNASELINPKRIYEATGKECSDVVKPKKTASQTQPQAQCSAQKEDVEMTNQREDKVSIELLMLAEPVSSLTVQRAIRYFRGEGVPRDVERGFNLLNKAIEENHDDPQAYYFMGVYQETKKDIQSASEYYKKGCDLNHSDSMTRLGVLGVKHNIIEKEEAKRLLEMALAKGNIGAAYGLGLLDELNGDFSNAVEHYSEAAELGNAIAQNALGCLYAEGKGVTESEERAMQWFKLAADQNLVSAMTNYGIRILGSNNTQEAKKGEEMLRYAAKKGNRLALTFVRKLDAEIQAEKRRQQEAERRRREEAENEQALNDLMSTFSSIGSYAKSKLWD